MAIFLYIPSGNPRLLLSLVLSVKVPILEQHIRDPTCKEHQYSDFGRSEARCVFGLEGLGAYDVANAVAGPEENENGGFLRVSSRGKEESEISFLAYSRLASFF